MASEAAPAQHQFVPRAARGEGGRGGGNGKGKRSNHAAKFAGSVLKSEVARADGQLHADMQKVLEGHCFYLPHLLCEKKDFALLQALTGELEQHEQEGMVDWSQHLKHENPDFSATFREIIRRLEDYFDVDVYASRLNFYRDGRDWKPFHHDSHAYGANGKREDFTMGASFGQSRELAFLHEPSGAQFAFPQHNGDVFAFTSEANQRFKHGVPKVTGGAKLGPRISIIGWGRRRSLNERNSAATEVQQQQQQHADQPVSPPSPSLSPSHRPTHHSPHTASASPAERIGGNGDVRVDGKELAEMVERLVLEESNKGRGTGKGKAKAKASEGGTVGDESGVVKKEKKKRNRVQGRPWS